MAGGSYSNNKIEVEANGVANKYIESVLAAYKSKRESNSDEPVL